MRVEVRGGHMRGVGEQGWVLQPAPGMASAAPAGVCLLDQAGVRVADAGCAGSWDSVGQAGRPNISGPV